MYFKDQYNILPVLQDSRNYAYSGQLQVLKWEINNKNNALGNRIDALLSLHFISITKGITLVICQPYRQQKCALLRRKTKEIILSNILFSVQCRTVRSVFTTWTSLLLTLDKFPRAQARTEHIDDGKTFMDRNRNGLRTI